MKIAGAVVAMETSGHDPIGTRVGHLNVIDEHCIAEIWNAHPSKTAKGGAAYLVVRQRAGQPPTQANIELEWALPKLALCRKKNVTTKSVVPTFAKKAKVGHPPRKQRYTKPTGLVQLDHGYLCPGEYDTAAWLFAGEECGQMVLMWKGIV
jgi:hypothetical protein